MTSPVLFENYYDGAFLVREANGYFSRDPGLIANANAGGTPDVQYQAGLVLSYAGGVVPTVSPKPGNVGNGTLGTVTTAGTAPGTYTVEVTESDGTFEVYDAGGELVGLGKVGSAFNGAGLGFTASAGGTAFAVGDAFQVAVMQAGTAVYAPYTGAGSAVAILYNRLYVSAGQQRKVTVISRQAEVNAAELQWDPANTAATQAVAQGQLAAAGIIFR